MRHNDRDLIELGTKRKLLVSGHASVSDEGGVCRRRGLYCILLQYDRREKDYCSNKENDLLRSHHVVTCSLSKTTPR